MISPVYDHILSGVTDDLEQRVLRLLLDNRDRRVTRQEFVSVLFGIVADDLEGSPEDRQVRRSIQNLRDAGWPILSDSATPGYQLETNEEKIKKFAAAQSSRSERIGRTAQNAYRSLAKARAINEALTTQQTVTQPSLI